jgi:hypothetical protein
MRIERFQKRIYLGILVLVLIPAVGGVVQYSQVYWSTWQMPVWTGPHQPGFFFGEGPAHLRMMILATLLTTVALTLVAGFYLVYTFKSLESNDSLFPEGKPDSGESHPKQAEEGHPGREPVAQDLPAEFLNNGKAFLTETLPRLASQAAEVAQNANQVMEQSLLALQRCNELTQVTQEVAAENRRNVMEVRRFLEEMAASLGNQTRSFH